MGEITIRTLNKLGSRPTATEGKEVYNYTSMCLRNSVSRKALSGQDSVIKGLPVKVVLSMSRSNPFQVGDVSSYLPDGLHLLMQKVALDEVTHLRGRQSICEVITTL